MKFEYVAFCSNSNNFWGDEIKNLDFTNKFPGASWIPYLSEKCENHNIKLISGKKAIESKISARKILVIQEMNSWHGINLINKGAFPLIIFSGESKLYAYYYYDFFRTFSKPFYHRLTFFENKFLSNNKFSHFFFPSFSLKEKMKNNIDWNKRDFSVLIASNKSIYSNPPKGNVIFKLKWFILSCYKRFSPSFIKAKKNSLHVFRHELILFFAKKNQIKLFGSQWTNNKIFPSNIRSELSFEIHKLNPNKVEDKHKVIQGFKFCFCIENTQEIGYITEKIIDSIKAETIPVYVGAPDINNYVPSNCFININSFNNLNELYDFLNNISEENAYKIIENGKIFLKSEEGKRFSYEFLAEFILKKIKDVNKHI